MGYEFKMTFQCVMLKVIGVWPQERNNKISFFLYHIWAYTLIGLIALTCMAQINYFIKTWGDILNVTECGCTVLMGVHNLFRLIHLKLCERQMHVLLKMFARNIWIPRGDNHISKNCRKEMVPVNIMGFMLTILICMYVVLPIIELFTTQNHSTYKPFPYKMVLPYETDSVMVYGITYCLTSIAGFGVVFTLLAEDGLICFLIIYVCGHFKMIHRDIDEIMATGINTVNKDFRGKQNYNGRFNTAVQNECVNLLKKIIMHQNIVFGFCNHMEQLFSPVLFINLVINSFLICFVGFQIATVKMSNANLMKFVIYIISVLNQLFILCWNGDKLIEHSTNTALHFYQCEWEGFELKRDENKKAIIRMNSEFRKFNIITINRSQKPVKLSGFKFFDLSLFTFTKVLSTSLSYFTLLQQLID